MDDMFSCTSCRHCESESDEPCMTCDNQSNWEPTQAVSRSMMSDLDLFLAEIDGLQEDLDRVSDENVLLRAENVRLRAALHDATKVN